LEDLNWKRLKANIAAAYLKRSMALSAFLHKDLELWGRTRVESKNVASIRKRSNQSSRSSSKQQAISISNRRDNSIL
jgi:hypothetical protein